MHRIRSGVCGSVGTLLHTYKRRRVQSVQSMNTKFTQHPKCLQVLCCVSCICVDPAAAAGGSVSVDADPTIVNIPNSLSSVEDSQSRKSLSKYFEGPQRRQIQDCTKACVTTCTRGGAGASKVHAMIIV